MKNNSAYLSKKVNCAIVGILLVWKDFVKRKEAKQCKVNNFMNWIVNSVNTTHLILNDYFLLKSKCNCSGKIFLLISLANKWMISVGKKTPRTVKECLVNWSATDYFCLDGYYCCWKSQSKELLNMKWRLSKR
jgi:hypothetical protein